MARKPYPSDLMTEQGSLIEPLIPLAELGGRDREVDMRQVINGILSLSRTGCWWRQLPHDLPPWGTVHYDYRRFRLDGTWPLIHDKLREKVRRKAGKKPTPIAAVIDSQTVKTAAPQKGAHGYDAGKKITGKKRHIVVDTLGLILTAVVHGADIQDRDGGEDVQSNIVGLFGRLKLIWADGGYAGQFVDLAKHMFKRTIEMVKRTDANQFMVLPKRWIVERTFGWFSKYRRLSKDDKTLPSRSESMIYITMINLMLHRLEPE